MHSKHASLLVSFLMITVVAGGAAADERTIRLDDGRELRGTMREVTPQRLLIQTETTMFEVSADHVESVDGSPLTPAMLATEDRLIVSTHYVTVKEDGSVELLTRNRTVNRGSDIITSLSSGRRRARARDGAHHAGVRRFRQSTRLPTRAADRKALSPHGRGRSRAARSARRAGFPGVAISVARRRSPHRIRPRPLFPGDFPDDRLYTRVVRLPAGAEVLDVTPEPMKRFDHDSAPHIVWRRYYPAGHREDLVVIYRLNPGSGSGHEADRKNQ